ncbi:hypothetical protein [Methylobacterium oryzisoli]|uniref:hypothetical protein n=1 Tax=Methylobacterium oryzisoli TaxID=3385502 RepID=UPI0038911B95
MSNHTPRTRSWIAKEVDLSAYGSIPFVIISAEVEVGHDNAEPYLCQICTSDFGPHTLVLTLRAAAHPHDGHVPATKPVHFKKIEKYGRYDNVMILWNGEQLQDLPIARAA